MSSFEKQFKQQANNLSLKVAERRELKARVASYMAYHPLLEGSVTRHAETLRSEPFGIVKLSGALFARYAGAAMIFFLVVVPVIAERAVPGDVLYPVKISFNEELRSTLALSPYQKVEWETTRLERRIAEARTLANEGKLTPEVEAAVAVAVKEHSDAAQREIATLRESDTDEAALAEINFASALEVQSEVLEGHLAKEGAVNGTTSTSTGRSVAALASVVGEARATAAALPIGSVSYDKLQARVEAETTRAYEYFDSIDSLVTATERTDIERRLQDIKVKIDEATNNSTETALDDRTASLTVALTDTRKLISFMTNIDVRQTVAIEELVPVTLTRDERVAIVQNCLAEGAALLEIVNKRDAALSVTTRAKVQKGQRSAAEFNEKASKALEQNDFDSAEIFSKEVLAIAGDLELLTSTAAATTEPKATSTTATTTASSTAVNDVNEEAQ